MNHPNHMKQRPRGRGPNGGGGGGGGPGGKNRHMNSRSQVFDSNGPEGRIRGSAHQVMEKYLAMARDASSQGDRVAAENYYQHAEHYFRLINAHNQSSGQRRPPNLATPAEDQIDGGMGYDEGEGDEGEGEAEQADDSQPENAGA